MNTDKTSTDRQTDRQRDIQTERHVISNTYRRVNTQSGRGTYKQYLHTYTQTTQYNTIQDKARQNKRTDG